MEKINNTQLHELDYWEKSHQHSQNEFYCRNLKFVPLKEQVVKIITERLLDLLENNCKDQDKCLKSSFTMNRLPKMSLDAYIQRILRFSACSAEAYLIALILIDRYHEFESYKGFSCLTHFNAHK